MRKLIFFFLVLIFQLGVVTPVFAHLPGQMPYFKLDGVYSKLYPVPATSLEDFPLPQDLAEGTFLINKPITFEFDIQALPAPPDIIQKTRFYWDFGDGAKGSGLKNTHTFTKGGSYLVVIEAETDEAPKQVIQSTMVHVLPSGDYQLPKAVIKIKGEESQDPLMDPFRIKFLNPIAVDATFSTAPSSKIVSYFWDFGDRTSSKESKITHQFSDKSYNSLVVLRIVDDKGFIADSYAEIINEDDNIRNQAGRAVQQVVVKNEGFGYKLVMGGLGFLIVLGGIWWWGKRKRK